MGNVGERRRRRAKRASNKSRAGVPRNVGELQSSRASPMMGLGTVGCVPWSPCRLGCHVVAGPWPRCRRQTSWQSPCSPRSVSIEQRTKSTKQTKQTTRPRGARGHCRSVRRCGWPSRILLVGPCACRVRGRIVSWSCLFAVVPCSVLCAPPSGRHDMAWAWAWAWDWHALTSFHLDL